MGSDVLYYCPCCHKEDFEPLNDDQYICDHSGEVFTDKEVLKEVCDYRDEEVHRSI